MLLCTKMLRTRKTNGPLWMMTTITGLKQVNLSSRLVELYEEMRNCKVVHCHNFGIVDTSTTPATGYLRMVNRRDAATLLPIIQNVIQPGSIIHSDQWRAYHGIQQQLGLQHRTVNHSLNFVDPGTGVHTQHIESYWNKCKGRFKTMHGTTIGKLPSYLDEFMWWDRFGRTHQDCFDNIQRHIAEFYPV